MRTAGAGCLCACCSGLGCTLGLANGRTLGLQPVLLPRTHRRPLCATADEFYALVDANLAADSGMDLRGLAHMAAHAAAAHDLPGLQQAHAGGRGAQADGQGETSCALWHRFCLHRAALVLEAVAAEAPAGGGSDVGGATMEQLVQWLGRSPQGAPHFTALAAEAARRIRAALAGPQL